MEQTSRGAHASSRDKGKGRAPLQDKTPTDSDDQDELEEDEDPEDPEDPEDEGEEGTDSNDGHLMALDWSRPVYDTDATVPPIYAFQIAYAKVEPYSLRIRDRGGVACSCQEPDCRHKEWLLRQLSRVPSPQTAGAGPGPASVDYYNRIRRAGRNGLEDVCVALDWEFRREGDTDAGTEWELRKLPPPPGSARDPERESHRSLNRSREDEAPGSQHRRQTRTTTAQRVKTIRDIMDTFYGLIRPADYRQDIFKDPTNIDANNFLVQGDLEATFSRLLMFNDQLFHFFELRVSDDARAVNVFLDLQLRAVEALSRLDNYVDNGPGEDGQHYDIPWCAQRLVEIVNEIDTNVRERGGGLLSPLSLTTAAQVLVQILNLVVDRNKDAYAGITWHRPRRHAEGRVHRNLYERLIGTTGPENPSDGPFVLDALRDLAPAAVSPVEKLEAILFKIGPRGTRAPEAYQIRLRELINQLRRVPRPDPPGPSSSSGKRSGGSTSADRNIKRMK